MTKHQQATLDDMWDAANIAGPVEVPDDILEYEGEPTEEEED